MTFGKRQLVIAALVASLGAAVYLNWQFSGNTPAVETQTKAESSRTADSSLGKTTYVNTTPSQESSREVSREESTASKSEESSKSGAFDRERKKRDKANAQALEALTDLIESSSANEQAKKEAVAASEALSAVIRVTADLENMIAMKGFEDVYAAVNNGSCTITVKGGELTEENLLAIRDMVNRQAGIDFDKITVSSVS